MRTPSPCFTDEFNLTTELLGSMPQEEIFDPDLARTFQQLPNSHVGQSLVVGVECAASLGHNAMK